MDEALEMVDARTKKRKKHYPRKPQYLCFCQYCKKEFMSKWKNAKFHNKECYNKSMMHPISTETIIKAVKKNGGNMSKAAKQLGLNTTLVHNRMQKWYEEH